MSKRKSKVSSAITIIAAVLLLILLFGVISVAFDTKGFKEFDYLSKDGVKIGERTTISLDESTTFELKYLKTSDKENKNISVKVYANNNSNFTFVTGEGNYSYKGVGELTDCFNIECESEKFTISVKEDCKTMADMLATKYGKVEYIHDWKNDEHFKMEVKTDFATYNFLFTIQGFYSGFISIELDQSEIIF